MRRLPKPNAAENDGYTPLAIKEFSDEDFVGEATAKKPAQRDGRAGGLLGRYQDRKLNPKARVSQFGPRVSKFLKKEFGTAVDQDRHERRKNFFKPVREQHVVEERVDPSVAMKMLLQHVSMDPDGGILNLDEMDADPSSKDVGFQQSSKVWALKKTGPEIPLAFLACIRSIMNPAAVLYFSFHILHDMYFDEDFMVTLENNSRILRMDVGVMVGLLVFTTSMELLGILVVLWQGILSLCRAFGASFYSEASADDDLIVEPLYVHLAKFWWTDLPLIQSFSALNTLAFVHPERAARNAKEFDITNELSLRALERILNLQTDTFHEGFLVQGAMRLANLERVLSYEEGVSGSMKANEIEEALTKSPYEALCEVETWAQSKAEHELHELEQENEVNVEALRRAWRVHTMRAMDTVVFLISSLVCLLWGFAAFYTKACRLFFALAAGHSIWYSFVYMLAFLNQVISIVQLNQLMRWRVAVFIFGGTDAVVSSEERYIMDMYLAVLASKVWQSNEFKFWEKVAVMLMFDDDDVQQLVIEEKETCKAAVILAVKQYMAQHDEQTWGSRVADYIL
eukprot:TRINITY_DN9288_c0_g1_i1.p1 TRINITY_DN9288_c0_g1~~TRINITY_DN9288_c0_g1_i1.p1  ORF type:complete len:569 (-),score=120.61 TRINITY_DN9288_c0_g1_i1:65-1771(-)